MKGILILTHLNILVIEHIFSRILKIVSLEVLSKENLPFWDSKKWDLGKLIQKIEKWNNVQVFKKLGKISTSW